MKWLIGFLACVLAQCAAAQSGPLHWPTRISVASIEVGSIGTGQVMLAGDSITESFWWNQFGDKRVLNAGQGGAGIDEVTATVQALLPVARPSVVVLMVGINDCRRGSEADPTIWGSKYLSLLQAIHAGGAVPVALSILPVENDPAKPLGTAYFNPTCYQQLNSQWYAITSSRNEVAVNLGFAFAVPPAYIYMNPGWTLDGVHPYGVGMATLYYQIVPAVATALTRTP